MSRWLNSKPGATALHSLEIKAYELEDNLSPLESKPSSFFFDDLVLKRYNRGVFRCGEATVCLAPGRFE